MDLQVVVIHENSTDGRANLAPSHFRRSVLPGDFSRDEAFRDIPGLQIEMPVDRADLAGDVEARDRFFHRVEHALLDVVLGTALRVVDDGPGFHDVIRRIFDRHLVWLGITVEIGVGVPMLLSSQASVLAGFRVME